VRVRSFLVAALALLAGGGTLAAAEPTPAARRSGSAASPVGGLDGLLGGFSLGGEGGPVRIDADTMEFDYKDMVLTYRGGVTVTQADMTLRSDLLRLVLDRERPEEPKEVVAEGKVQIDKGSRQATGGRAVFDAGARTVTLSDKARLRDGPNEVAGERVIVFLDEERSVVEGGDERVRAVLHPPADKAGDGR
jgi:lipopolysaccharide export system protein LptA